MDGTPTTTFDAACSVVRTQIKDIGTYVLNLKSSIGASLTPLGSVQDTGEMIANVTLAYRHLEDAAMRMGKAIQAYEGGKSIYDSNDAKRAAGVQTSTTGQAQA
jgi:hypothetical protein